jgi:hypothetical protein
MMLLCDEPREQSRALIHGQKTLYYGVKTDKTMTILLMIIIVKIMAMTTTKTTTMATTTAAAQQQ